MHCCAGAVLRGPAGVGASPEPPLIRPSSHRRDRIRPGLAAVACALALCAPVVPARADVAPLRLGGPVEVEPAVAAGSGSDAGSQTPAQPVPSPEELATIRARLDAVQDALERQSAENRQIFILLFLALIILVVNIIVQQRRK